MYIDDDSEEEISSQYSDDLEELRNKLEWGQVSLAARQRGYPEEVCSGIYRDGRYNLEDGTFIGFPTLLPRAPWMHGRKIPGHGKRNVLLAFPPYNQPPGFECPGKSCVDTSLFAGLLSW
jgi:hypothetical protein